MPKHRSLLPILLLALAALLPTGKGAVAALELEVLTFNAFLRPSVMAEGQDRRAPLMAEQLAGRDILLLQEVFSDRHRMLLLEALAEAYPYRTRVLGRDRGFAQDGGVMILSRWPIEAEFQKGFGRLCAGKDCLADKGVLYARIAKAGRRVHVLATHLQSGRDNHALRLAQLRVIKDLIEAMAIPPGEPVLLGGDLNVDRLAPGAAAADGPHGAMLAVLGAAEPAPAGGRHRPTFDPAGNPLARHGRAQILDYLLVSQAHLQPLEAASRVTPIVAGDLALSDHFGLQARFVFPEPEEPAATPRPAIATLYAGTDPQSDFLCDLLLLPGGSVAAERDPACRERPVRAIALRNLAPGQRLELRGSAPRRRFDDTPPSLRHDLARNQPQPQPLPAAFASLTLVLLPGGGTPAALAAGQ